ncbi:MAG: leucyl/phenylalanyl-tRNA--protein transferase [Gammaproteobacteria bacterium]|nr:leucyl/phenylalanyl-tRNA--protein transferase [Gammaproteobacteria bacterium]
MHWLPADTWDFPPVTHAPADAPLAVGGDLHPQRLLRAYRLGIFPWYNEPPILWWSPDPRMVVAPQAVRINRSLARSLRRASWTLSFDRAFAEVIRACAAPRRNAQGTWLSAEMIAAYEELHRLGFAHSVECWQDTKLIGGLYGIALGGAFFGESMFSLATDASKIAFVRLAAVLARWNFSLIDCQVSSAHMASLGAVALPRETFLARLRDALAAPPRPGPWRDITGLQ